MPASPRTEKTIFLEAAEIDSATERAAFLERSCSDDQRLRAAVEALLLSHQQSQPVLDAPAVARTIDMQAEPHIAAAPGTAIGPYKLLQQIGEGGMGTVYMAEQTHPVQRKVALKVIKAGMDSQQVIARFESERQALAMMDHVNIARVLDAGATEAGRPYFVMELVHGVPITRYCDDNHLTPRQRLELFVPVCQAIQHAHQKGIIHRDIKPSNVMVTLYDGKPVPKVIDFGVAKATEQKLTERTLFTQYGTMVGTLEYMSPEQAEMSALGVDTRSDIFSLGVLLYELLTGSTPLSRKRVREAAYGEVLRLIKEEEPPKPSTRLSDSGEALASISAQRHMEPAKLAKLVRGELDWIVMKTLEKDRNRRYETANGLAADVQRYLDDEAVQACPPSAMYRFRKFARRNKAVLATVTLISVAMGVAVVVLAVSNVWVTRERNQTKQALRDEEAALVRESAALNKARKQEELARKNAADARTQQGIAEKESSHAREQERLARRRYYAAQMNLAQQAWEAANQPRMLELLETQRPYFDEEDQRSFEWYHLWQQCHRQLRLTLRGPRFLGQSAVYSPDGKTIAATSATGLITLWDAATGIERDRFQGYSGHWQQIAFSPDGKLLAHSSGPTDNDALLWDLKTRTSVVLVGTGAVRCLAFSPDGKTLALGPERATQRGVSLWNVESREKITTLEGHLPVLSVAFAPDGKTLAASQGWSQSGGGVAVWELEASPPRVIRRVPSALVLVFARDGKTLFTHEPLKSWNVATGAEQTLGSGSNDNVALLAVSRDGRFLAYNSHPKSVTVRELATGNTQSFTHINNVDSVDFSPDGSTLLTGSTRESVLKCWDIKPVDEALSLEQSDGFRGFTFSPDGRSLAGIQADGTIRIWDSQSGRQRRDLRGNAGGFLEGSLAFSPDGQLLAAAQGEWDGTAAGEGTVWNVATGQIVTSLKGHTASIWCIAFSPDGKTLASAGQDGVARLWDVGTWQTRFTVSSAPIGTNPCDYAIHVLAFSRNGTLAVGGQWGNLHFFDSISGGKKLGFWESFEGRFQSVISLAFSPDGRRVATGATDGTTRLRDAASGEILGSFKGASSQVTSLAFFPDGRTLASGHLDGKTRLWDVATFQERITLPVGRLVAIAPDGLTLAVGGNKDAKLWRASTDPDALAYRTEIDPSKFRDPAALLRAADHLLTRGKFQNAIEAYSRALSCLELGGDAQTADETFRLARMAIKGWKNALQSDSRMSPGGLNDLAWKLATSPVLQFRDSGLAVELATKALEMSPQVGSQWNTLGVAHYRSGNWKAAVAALERSVEIRKPDDSFDWFFLAMAHWQLGEQDEARKWFDQAVEWMEKNQSQNVEVKRFRAEATELLGLKDAK